jgi:hypothetical protein
MILANAARTAPGPERASDHRAEAFANQFVGFLRAIPPSVEHPTLAKA